LRECSAFRVGLIAKDKNVVESKPWFLVEENALAFNKSTSSEKLIEIKRK